MIVNKKQQEPETLLQGFLRSQEKSIDQITKLSGKDGLFVDKLNNEQSRRPNIWWIQIKEGETMSSYFTRAHAEAKKRKLQLMFSQGWQHMFGSSSPRKLAHATATCMDPPRRSQALVWTRCHAMLVRCRLSRGYYHKSSQDVTGLG